MAADTLLLVCPPDDPLGLLTNSVGGGSVPRMELCSCGVWYTPAFFGPRRIHEAHRTYTPDTEALVLQFNGAPDEIGMGRALAAVGRLYRLPVLVREPEDVGAFLVARAPAYRLTTLAADGREKES